MARGHYARKLVDKTWLKGSGSLLVVTRKRVERDAAYAEALKNTLLELFDQLWPTQEEIPKADHLAQIGEDVDRMPRELLESLVDSLAEYADAAGTPQSPQNAAARLLAGWLRTRGMEMWADGEALAEAERMKPKYPELFAELVLPRGAAEVPAEAEDADEADEADGADEKGRLDHAM